MLEEARSVCDHLIVGLQVDPSCDRKNKNRPVQSLKERRIQLGAVRYVDEIIEYKTERDLYELLKELEPDVRIIGADHRGTEFTGFDLPPIVFFNSRDHKWSTTELRERIYKQESARRPGKRGELRNLAAYENSQN